MRYPTIKNCPKKCLNLWDHYTRSVLSACSPDRSYNKSLYDIVRLANKINSFPEKFRKNFQFRNQGFGTFPKEKMSVSAARQKRSFFRCVRTPDVLAILHNFISADTTRSRFRKSRGAYFLRGCQVFEKKSPLKSKKKFFALPPIRRKSVRCKVKGVFYHAGPHAAHPQGNLPEWAGTKSHPT